MGSKFDVVEGGPKTIPLVFEINNHIILISPVEQLVKEGLHTRRFCMVVEEFSECGIIDIFVYLAVWFEVVDKHQK